VNVRGKKIFVCVCVVRVRDFSCAGTALVNKPNDVTDGPDVDKVVDMANVIELRKLMATLIKALAELEDQVASDEEFESIGRGSKKGGEFNGVSKKVNYAGF
jgi:hypothetical protein